MVVCVDWLNLFRVNDAKYAWPDDWEEIKRQREKKNLKGIEGLKNQF